MGRVPFVAISYAAICHYLCIIDNNLILIWLFLKTPAGIQSIATMQKLQRAHAHSRLCPEEPLLSLQDLMVSLSSPIAITYTLCAGDADRAGDER